MMKVVVLVDDLHVLEYKHWLLAAGRDIDNVINGWRLLQTHQLPSSWPAGAHMAVTNISETTGIIRDKRVTGRGSGGNVPIHTITAGEDAGCWRHRIDIWRIKTDFFELKVH